MQTHIVPIQKNGDAFAAGDRVWFDRDLKLATAEVPVDGLLCGLCAADAPRERFAVLVHVPVAEPNDLRVIQCVSTGRRVPAGSEIVHPVMVHRRFKPHDEPKRDRHPVEFLEECLDAGTAVPADVPGFDWGGITEDELVPPGVELAVQDDAPPADEAVQDPGPQDDAPPAAEAPVERRPDAEHDNQKPTQETAAPAE